MVFWLQVILLLVILYVTYRFWYLFQIRRKIDWIPSAPLKPFLGTSLEFGSNTVEFLGKMEKILDNPDKSTYFELGLSQFGIATKNQDIMEFLLTSNKVEMLTKSIEYNLFRSWLGTGLITSDGMKWKKRRRIITPAFHFSILDQFVDVFESNGNILIDLLRKEAVNKDSVNIYPYVTNCVLDVISETACGVSIGSQQGRNQDYVEAVKEFCRIMVKRSFSPIFTNDTLFKFTSDYQDSKRSAELMHDFTDKIINDRVQELKKKGKQKVEENSDGVKRKMAFLDLLLNSTIDGKPLSKEDIREEVDSFMFAGHDTTSFALSMTLYLLATHPEIQALARNEQLEMFGNDRSKSTTIQDLNEMKYLDLVVRESVRLHSPVPNIGREMTQDVEYKGHIIPKGTRFMLFLYGINRDPDYHEKAHEFIPERHLNPRKNYFSLIPFSAGPRNCIGKKFAVLELKSLLSKILRNFELFPADPEQKPVLAMEAVLKAKNGIHVRLENYEKK